MPADTSPFLGVPASTIGPFTATTTSAAVAIPLPSGGSVRIVNTGTSACRIAYGTTSAAVVTKPTPGTLSGGVYTGGTPGSKLILPGSVEILTPPVGSTFVAFATDSGTTTIEFTPGQGL